MEIITEKGMMDFLFDKRFIENDVESMGIDDFEKVFNDLAHTNPKEVCMVMNYDAIMKPVYDRSRKSVEIVIISNDGRTLAKSDAYPYHLESRAFYRKNDKSKVMYLDVVCLGGKK